MSQPTDALPSTATGDATPAKSATVEPHAVDADELISTTAPNLPVASEDDFVETLKQLNRGLKRARYVKRHKIDDGDIPFDEIKTIIASLQREIKVCKAN